MYRLFNYSISNASATWNDVYRSFSGVTPNNPALFHQ